MSVYDLTCANLTELVTDYLEGTLPPVQQTSFETHVVYCTDCMAFLSQIRDTVVHLGSLPPDPVDPHEREELVDAFRRRR